MSQVWMGTSADSLVLVSTGERKGQRKGAAWGLQVTTEDGTLRPRIPLHFHGLGANTQTAAPSQQLPAQSWKLL